MYYNFALILYLFRAFCWNECSHTEYQNVPGVDIIRLQLDLAVGMMPIPIVGEEEYSLDAPPINITYT